MRVCWAILLSALFGSAAWAQKSEPANVYLFPAGGQRGTRVEVAVEGENVTTLCDFHLTGGRGVTAPPQARERRIALTLAPDAPLGLVPWRIATAQGGAGARAFVVGEYPEILEKERDVNDPTPEPVQLPVTVNGRINPDGDVDRFSFDLRAGQPFSAEVMAARLGGAIDTNCFVGQFGNPPDDPSYKQLDATLELYGPDARLLAQAEDTFGLDPALGFVAPKDGRYVVAVRHMAHAGMPQFVYRLTLAPVPLVLSAYPAGGRRGTTVATRMQGPGLGEGARADARLDGPGSVMAARLASGSTPYPLQVSDWPEEMEQEPNDSAATATPAAVPAVLNGRLQKPGDTDLYRVSLHKGEAWRFETWVERLGSATDTSLAVLTAAGQTVASSDAGAPGSRDPRVFFTPPADGEYLLQIRETAMSRLGERLVYRLEAVPQPPDFQVEASAELLDMQPGGVGDLEVAVRRLGGFAGAVQLEVQGLPEGVAAAPLELPPGQEKAKLHLTAVAGCRSGSWPVRIAGKALLGGAETTRLARAPVANPAETALGSAPRWLEDVLLTVRFPAPFKIEADDSYLFLNLGSLYPARITVTREPGFTEPLLFTMADRQPRHPYGVTFPPMTVTGTATEVFFPMRLPQGPRGNEIVRVYVKAETAVKDREGREWRLLQTSPKQVVSRTVAPVLSLSVEPDALRAKPGSAVPIRFRVGRTAMAAGAAEIRLQPAPGVTGISLDPVQVPAGGSEAGGTLRVAQGANLGRASDLWFEITSRRDNGQAVFYQARLVFDLRPSPR
jgi:hypothetical protein